MQDSFPACLPLTRSDFEIRIIFMSPATVCLMRQHCSPGCFWPTDTQGSIDKN